MEKKDLKPAGVFKYFEEICQVPRPSKKEEKIIAYLKAFGVKHNLETNVDEAGNVLIKKPATPGKENLQTVILQSYKDACRRYPSNTRHMGQYRSHEPETIAMGGIGPALRDRKSVV